MKRIFILSIALFSFMTYLLLPDDVSALTLPNPNRSCVTDISNNRSCSSPGISNASWWDQAFFESTYHLGDFGSGGNIYQSIQFEWDSIGLCTGQTILIKGTVGGLTGFFSNGYNIQVWNNSAQMDCSFQQVDTSRVNFTCSGIGGGPLWVYVNQTSFTPGVIYQIGLSKNLDVTCSASSSDVIINQNQNTENIINNQNQNTQQIIQGQEDIKDAITDDTPPDTSGLENSAGWLPAGPLDSILNLPLTMFQNLLNALSNQCTPVTVNLPYVDEPITLPCISVIFSQIDGLSTWWNSIGLLLGGYILLKYLIGLEKWADATLTFRENNWNDWGGV